MEPVGERQKQENDPDTGAAGQSTKPTVCFLGPISSYTHQATLDTFPTDKFDLMPVETIKDIFDTTQSGRASCGVVPFENSSNGAVLFTLDQLADRDGEYPDLQVCAEIYLDVHHCLVGRRSPSSSSLSSPSPATKHEPETDLSHIARIYSHPQAFGQCAGFLRTRLRGVETVDVSSTSRAAQMAAEDGTGRSAAISSAAAAQMLGLDVLARNIEDRADNTTRFFVLTRGAGGSSDSSSSDPSPLHPVPGLEEVLGGRRRRRRQQQQQQWQNVESEGAEAKAKTEETSKEEEEGEGEEDVYALTKSLASFTVPHRSPGALADVLDSFRRARLNLTSIGSRPSLAAPFRYVFFVEFEGHRRRDPEGRVRDALARVAAAAQSCRWWGSWDNMR